jgi:hypothetical protein
MGKTMRFDVPKITRPLLLSNYSPEFPADAVFQIWVNPPNRLLFAIKKLTTSEKPDPAKGIKVYAELWGISVQELLKFVETYAETDPALAPWCIAQTVMMISEYQNALKKRCTVPLSQWLNKTQQNYLNMPELPEIKENLQRVDAEFTAWRNNNARK